jgi:response regulator of citrate/malate metabolism
VSEPRRVLIVEDDVAVAAMHRAVVESVPGLRIVGIAGGVADAKRLAARMRPGLALLDLGLPDGSGLGVLRWLRGHRTPIEVIAITAASRPDLVREAVHLGVVDYLVKPFPLERLRHAVAIAAARTAALGDAALDQAGVDRFRAGGAPARRLLPKDLRPATIARVRAALAAATGPVTADDAGHRAGVARVTARRYLEYLVTVGEAVAESDPQGPGRPRKRYRATRPPGSVQPS